MKLLKRPAQKKGEEDGDEQGRDQRGSFDTFDGAQPSSKWV